VAKGKIKGILIHVFLDILSASIAWFLLFVFRKIYLENNTFSITFLTSDLNFQLGIFLIPLAWVALYFLSGTYTDIYRKSRLISIGRTLLQSLIGCIILFFAFLLDDLVFSYKNYYITFLFLFTTHFLLTATFRLILFTIAKNRMLKGKHYFPTVIIGSSQKAYLFFKEQKNTLSNFGNRIVGFVNVEKNGHEALRGALPILGSVEQLETIIEEYKVEDVVIALENTEKDKISAIINLLSGRNIIIRIIPSMFDILSGMVKMTQVTGAPLIEIYPDTMPLWQRNIKRLLDLLIAFLALVLLSPLFLILGLLVKSTSKGSIFYLQERIGHRGEVFKIIKFRSMYQNAEENGPALSSENDLRITPLGKVLRKWRLDELPQFINVLKGDMSLVGPRPERAFFIEKMRAEAPHCQHLQRVKPGITSLGMVKFGYAENVDEMIERLKYDIIYIENQSLTIDFKIMLYTVVTILRGRGK
jgi:exopolysaccharide biosynthesis polyprenyl glycosylphosphotransferase